MTPSRFWVRLLVPLLLLPAGLAGAAEPRIRVLILDGYSNHDWRLTTRLIQGILAPTGQFETTVSTAPPANDVAGWEAWRPRFSDYEVIIQTCNDLGGGPVWPRAVQLDFESFVHRGGGVYVWHAGNNAFAGWPAYNEMIGLGWRKKDFGWALAMGDDGKLVRIAAGDGEDTGHGAHAGLPRDWMTPDIEIYHYARGPANNLTVLSYGFDPVTKMNWPLEWTVAFGQGRVYTSTFGHVWKGDSQPARMRCAGLQTVVVRALQWLAGRPVTWPVPPDFPTATSVSVRSEIPLASNDAQSSGPFHDENLPGSSGIEPWREAEFPGYFETTSAASPRRNPVLAVVPRPDSP